MTERDELKESASWNIPKLGSLYFFVILSLFFSGLVTYGTFNFIGKEVRSDVYDSLGDGLLKFDSSVDPETITWEGFVIDGKTYIYFGPFPAILRILPNYFFREYFGQWSRISCLLGALLAVIGFSFCIATSLKKNLSLNAKAKDFLYFFSLFAFSFGTPLFYLIASARIYHEAIIWGFSAAIWSLHFAILFLTSRSISNALLLSLFAGIALLSRLTFGVPFYFMIAFLFAALFIEWLRQSKKPDLSWNEIISVGVALALPATVCLAIQLWYNYDRFSSIFTFINFTGNYLSPDEIHGVMNVARIPTALWNYLGFSVEPFLASFPFFRLAPVEYSDGSIFFVHREQTASLIYASPFFLFLSLIGLYYGFTKKGDLLRKIVSLVFIWQSICICCFYFVTQRYVLEFFPLLIWLFLFFLEGAGVAVLKSYIIRILITVTCFFSVLFTMLSTFHWTIFHNADIPVAYRENLIDWFYINGIFDGRARKQIFLSDLTSEKESYTYAPSQNNASFDGYVLTIKGASYNTGVGMHATSELEYYVPPGAHQFFAVIGISDNMLYCDAASMVFEVQDEKGTLIYSSGIVTNKSAPITIQADIRGVQKVKIILKDGGDGIDCDHGNWAQASFILEDI